MMHGFDDGPTEVTWARGRLPSRTYVSRTFRLRTYWSAYDGHPARYVYKVFEPEDDDVGSADPDHLELKEEVVGTSPTGRTQIKVQIAREAGNVRELQIQRVPADPSASVLETLLTLGPIGARR